MKSKKTFFSWPVIFFSLCLSRIISAIFNPIPDCDETYNYWEPLHLLFFKNGLQTWEYSPEYGLRSYFFVLLHAPAAFIGKLLSLDKVLIFFLVRGYIGCMCALAESFFVVSVQKSRLLGKRVGNTLFFALVFSSGMFQFGQNFLPGSFSMICLFFSFGSWVRSVDSNKVKDLKFHLFWCFFAAATSILIGWPFTVVCIFPMLVESLLRLLFKAGFVNFCVWCITRLVIIAGVLLGSSISIDWIYFRKFQFTAFNLAWYNRGSGSENFGTEPWDYYIRNLLANFNVLFVLSLAAPLVCLLRRRTWKAAVFTVPYFTWLLFYSSVPHKEERFMAPIASLVSLCGSVTIVFSIDWFFWILNKLKGKKKKKGKGKGKKKGKGKGKGKKKNGGKSNRIAQNGLITCVIVVTTVLSLLRVLSTVFLYSAPLRVWGFVANDLKQFSDPSVPINVCVGKEWYRFMTSFYLPYNHTRLFFVKSKFDGLLPKYFKDGPDATYSIPDGMNDRNEEEMDRYIPENTCHYLVDFDFVDQSEEHYYRDEKTWQIVYEDEFLDINQSKSSLARAFYIPGYSEAKNKFGKYYVVKNKLEGVF